MSGAVIKIEYGRWKFSMPPTISEDEYNAYKGKLTDNKEYDIVPKTGTRFYQSIKRNLYVSAIGAVAMTIASYIEKRKMEGTLFSVIDGISILLFLIGLYYFCSMLFSFRSYLSFLYSMRKYYREMKKDIMVSSNYKMFREIFCPKF